MPGIFSLKVSSIAQLLLFVIFEQSIQAKP